MRTKALYVVAVLILVGVGIALVIGRMRQSEPTPAPASAPETTAETQPELDGPPPPEDFAEQFAAEREQALIDDARERALDSARAEERERFETLKRDQAAASPNGQALRSLTRTEATEQRAKQFESEAVDRDWAPRAEAEALEKISQIGLNALNVRVECRTTVCRLEVVQRASERGSSIPIGLALLQLNELQPSPPMQTEDPGGTRTTVSYLARR